MNQKLLSGIIMGLFLFSFTLEGQAQQRQDDKDFYEKIATLGNSFELVRPMDTIKNVLLPANRVLKWSGGKKDAFAHQSKISNQEEIQKNLQLLKKKFAPFLQDVAPQLKDMRDRQRIDRMSFRYETEDDRKDFQNLLQGKGQWQEVNMPYYHGPQGISTAWYRKEIEISADFFEHPSLWLHFNGSDYYTDVFINGFQVGSHEGMLDQFSCNIKRYAHIGKNVLLVRVRNDYSMLGGEGTPRFWGNKLAASNSAGWDDPQSGWSCAPAGFGIYQELYLEGRSVPYIADVFCRPLFDHSKVELWVELDLEDGRLADSFSLECAVYGQNFEAEVYKEQFDSVEVVGGRVLRRFLIDIPAEKLRVWSPDTPWLYQAQVKLYDLKRTTLLDTRKQQFGMRKFVLDQNSAPKGRMYLNNNEVRLRGTNTMGFLQQDVMRRNWEQLIDDILLVKLTNMNFIRTTQRIMPQEVYEYADRLGMMMQADLPLFAYLNQKQYTEVLKQADGIERVLRNHPSVVLLSYMNEPMAEVKPHAISRYAYERLFDALDVVVRNINPDRAVKYVDGDYQAPSNGYPDNHCYNIWYDEHAVPLDQLCRGAWVPVSKGWMYGCGEFGAEGLDFVDLMKRRYPKEWLANQPDGTWSPVNAKGQHSGEQTSRMHWSWFETQTTMEGWVTESQRHQAWGVSKVARAFRRMPRMNSFAVHLFIDAWPNGWMKAIMDCERKAKPAWYVYREALTPLAVQVETERTVFYGGETYPFQVWICNDTYRKENTELRYMLTLDGKTIDSGRTDADMPDVSDGSRFQGLLSVKIPEVRHQQNLKVSVALFDKQSGILLHEESVDCTLYPAIGQLACKRDLLFYGEGEELNSLRSVLTQSKRSTGRVKGKTMISSKDVFIVVGSHVKADEIDRILAQVTQGAKVLFLKEAVNEWKDKLGLTVSKEDDSWIVARNASHRWMKGTTSTDFKYNYSSLLNAPERHYFQFLSGQDMTPVMTQKEGIVLGERREGLGTMIFCGLKLAGKIETTPSLMTLLFNMMNEK